MLTDKDLNNINGGRFKWTHGLLIGSIVNFISWHYRWFFKTIKV
jgi:bacteriocin-like protein